MVLALWKARDRALPTLRRTSHCVPGATALVRERERRERERERGREGEREGEREREREGERDERHAATGQERREHSVYSSCRAVAGSVYYV